jgi:hypothetical protein
LFDWPNKDFSITMPARVCGAHNCLDDRLYQLVASDNFSRTFSMNTSTIIAVMIFISNSFIQPARTRTSRKASAG